MRVLKSDNEPIYTDADLIGILKGTNAGFGILYKRHKSYCINFMKSIVNRQHKVDKI